MPDWIQSDWLVWGDPHHTDLVNVKMNVHRLYGQVVICMGTLVVDIMQEAVRVTPGSEGVR